MKTSEYLFPGIRTLIAVCLIAQAGIAASAEPVAAATDSDDQVSTDIAQGLFEEAINRRDAGDVFKAIRLFEIITEARPELDRAKLELAVAYHQANRYQDAIRELKAVLEKEDTPDNVRLSILAYLGQIQNDEKQPAGLHEFSYYLKAGLLHNSNLNASQAVVSGPASSSTTELSSIGTDFTASISHRYSKRDLYNIADTAASVEWLSQATFSSELYVDENDYNLNILTLSTGPAFISPGRWRASISMQADVIQLGGEQLATFVAFYPSITFDLGNYRSLLLETSWTTREYSDSINSDYDSGVLMLGAGFTTFLSEFGTGIEGGIRLHDENADNDGYSHTLLELYLAGYMSVDERLNAYGRLKLLSFDYDAADPSLMPPIVRDESEVRFALGINYDHTEGPLDGWVMNLELSTINSDSNADILDYDRTLISVNWSRYFN